MPSCGKDGWVFSWRFKLPDLSLLGTNLFFFFKSLTFLTCLESCLQVYTKFSCHGSAFRLASIPSSRSRCVEIWWFLCRCPSATTCHNSRSQIHKTNATRFGNRSSGRSSSNIYHHIPMSSRHALLYELKHRAQKGWIWMNDDEYMLQILDWVHVLFWATLLLAELKIYVGTRRLRVDVHRQIVLDFLCVCSCHFVASTANGYVWKWGIPPIIAI